MPKRKRGAPLFHNLARALEEQKLHKPVSMSFSGRAATTECLLMVDGMAGFGAERKVQSFPTIQPVRLLVYDRGL